MKNPTIVNSTLKELTQIVGEFLPRIEDFEQLAADNNKDVAYYTDTYNKLEVIYNKLRQGLECNRSYLRCLLKETEQMAIVDAISF